MTNPSILETTFFGALAKASGAERSSFLDEACSGNPELRRQVEKMLAAHDEAGEFMQQPGVTVDAQLRDGPSVAEVVGSSIGPYKLLQQIGEGGMGVVFMAEQLVPIRRFVALKIIRQGMDTRQVIARFEAERQALAVMDHPNVAKVLDAGTTTAGRPYFVMELVKGVPITTYCDDRKLSLRDRLDLFIPVCVAVQHAHQKGLIHRDIKPTNVLVAEYDNRAVPKVIDFGVAKAIAQSMTERTLFTEYVQVVGTVEYMSPEQAKLNQLDIDTRSDIYSLGVLLYELLTGTTPFGQKRLREAAFDEMLRIIRDEEPQKPSTRLSTVEALPSIAANRGVESVKLNRQIRGELDWIAMKCLEKDRSRRYESAAALASDISHYLSGLPVSAGAPSFGYRVRRFTRRHRVAVLVSTGFVALLALTTAVTTVGFIEQRRLRLDADRQRSLAETERGEAERSARIASAVSQFQREMFLAASPFHMGDKVTVLEVMTAAVKDLDAGKLKDEPIVEANVREIIGETLHKLGRYQEAEQLLRKALELRRSSFPGPHYGVARSLLRLGYALQELGRLSEAEAAMREALANMRFVHPAEHPEVSECMASLGVLLQVEGKYAEAEQLGRDALEVDRRRLPAGHVDLAINLGKLGWLLQVEGKFAEAELHCREALDIRRRQLNPLHPDIAESLNQLAVVLARTDRLPEAESLFREMLEIDRKSLPDGHPRIGQDLNNLAGALTAQDKFAEAASLHREGLEMRRRSLPAGHPYIAQSLYNLGVLLRKQGKPAEAEPLEREALSIRRSALPLGHSDIAVGLQELSATLQELGQYAESETLLLEAETIFAALQSASALRHERCVEALVVLYTAWDKAEPEKGYAAKAAHWQSLLPSTPPATSQSVAK